MSDWLVARAIEGLAEAAMKAAHSYEKWVNIQIKDANYPNMDENKEKVSKINQETQPSIYEIAVTAMKPGGAIMAGGQLEDAIDQAFATAKSGKEVLFLFETKAQAVDAEEILLDNITVTGIQAKRNPLIFQFESGGRILFRVVDGYLKGSNPDLVIIP